MRRGNVVKLPFAAGTFDRALAVNTIYYWLDLPTAFAEIARVLRPGGRLAVAFRSPESLRAATLAWGNFKRYELEEVAEAMRKAGFRVLRVARQNPWRLPDNLVLIRTIQGVEATATTRPQGSGRRELIGECPTFVAQRRGGLRRPGGDIQSPSDDKSSPS